MNLNNIGIVLTKGFKRIQKSFTLQAKIKKQADKKLLGTSFKLGYVIFTNLALKPPLLFITLDFHLIMYTKHNIVQCAQLLYFTFSALQYL